MTDSRKKIKEALQKIREGIKAWKFLKSVYEVSASKGGTRMTAYSRSIDPDRLKEQARLFGRAIKAVKKVGEKEGIEFK